MPTRSALVVLVQLLLSLACLKFLARHGVDARARVEAGPVAPENKQRNATSMVDVQVQEPSQDGPCILLCHAGSMLAA
eukprot:13187177-Alexandrium_andersonii.AAC.1